MEEKRIHIITGHYGSGKSEIAVNLAMDYSKKGFSVVFADLDIVNPYFRSNEARDKLENLGIKVITTKYANTNVDVPALTGELSRYLRDREKLLILDIGGDDAGAKVVGRYRDEMPLDEVCLYFTVNCFRPETQTLEGVSSILEEIRTATKMPVNYLINNANLLGETTTQDMEKGKAFALKVSKASQIPIAFHAVINKETAEGIDFQEPVFLMNQYMGYL